MVNSADPDQLASINLDLHCLQGQDISGFSRTKVNSHLYRSNKDFAFRSCTELNIFNNVIYQVISYWPTYTGS